MSRAIDRLRHKGRKAAYDDAADATDTRVLSADIADPELRLIVLGCHPRLTPVCAATRWCTWRAVRCWRC